MHQMVVLCDGIYRSASTWSFNVAMQLVKLANPGGRVFGLSTNKPEVFTAAVRPRGSSIVIKSHLPDPSVYKLITSGTIKAIFTWRDPFDAIASMIRCFGGTVESWMPRFRKSYRVWAFHRETGSALEIPYGDIMGSPEATIGRIASYLEIDARPEEIQDIAEATSFDSLREFTRQVTALENSRLIRDGSTVYDRKTLFHQNHIRDGAQGYGRKFLSSEQQSFLENVLREEDLGWLCSTVLDHEPNASAEPAVTY